MRIFLFGSIFLLMSSGIAASASAQTPRFSDIPSTHWAAQSVQKLAGAGILQGQPRNTPGAYDGSKPVTRYELAVTLWRFVQYLERADKQKKSPENASAPLSPKTAIQNLVAGGYLPKNTPLARDGGKVVTANQLGDMMTQVITRITEKKVPVSKDSLHGTPEQDGKR